MNRGNKVVNFKFAIFSEGKRFLNEIDLENFLRTLGEYVTGNARPVTQPTALLRSCRILVEYQRSRFCSRAIVQSVVNFLKGLFLVSANDTSGAGTRVLKCNTWKEAL